MYDRKSAVFAYHQKHFGDQTKVGYKDIIPKFKAEKFDAEAWADLFARSGAKFAGPVAVHHDNFAMWDSDVTPWNSVKMGPHRDITGELAKAIKGRGLKFLTTFHHGFAWRYYEPALAFDGADPRFARLYTEAHKPGRAALEGISRSMAGDGQRGRAQVSARHDLVRLRARRRHHARVPAKDVRRLLQLGGGEPLRLGRGA